MRLTHPVSDLPLRLSASLAPDFLDVVNKLGWGKVHLP